MKRLASDRRLGLIADATWKLARRTVCILLPDGDWCRGPAVVARCRRERRAVERNGCVVRIGRDASADPR